MLSGKRVAELEAKTSDLEVCVRNLNDWKAELKNAQKMVRFWEDVIRKKKD